MLCKTLHSDNAGSDTIVLKQNMLYGSSRLGLWERNKKLTFTPVTETIQSVYRGDKRYELSDHLGNVHVVLTDRKELHCGLEDNVPFPEYYTAEVKNRYDYYPFGMLMEERKYGASVCRYDIDTSFIATVMDQNFEEDPTLDAWQYVISSATPNYGSGSMLLDYDQDPLITYWPANEGDRYKVTFSFSFEGDCDSLQVLGNVQNSTTQSYTSGGTYTFDFTVNDVSGGYGVFGFYKDNPDCIVYIHSVKIEQYTTSTQVVCDTDSVAGYRYGFNGMEKIDEQYGIEGTAYDFGARLYDARLGRFMSVDPFTYSFPMEAPYAYASNSPILFLDIQGAFRFNYTDKELEKLGLTRQQVQRFEQILNNIKTANEGNEALLDAISKSTGLDKATILADLEPGKGPVITIDNGRSGMTGGKNGIQIHPNVLKAYAAVDFNDKDGLAEQTLGLMVSVLHEYTHYGDQITNDGKNSGQFSFQGHPVTGEPNKLEWDAETGNKEISIKFGKQYWKITATGHRGTDIEVFGYGLRVDLDASTNLSIIQKVDKSVITSPKKDGWPEIPKELPGNIKGQEILKTLQINE